jgi:hypothetical protein
VAEGVSEMIAKLFKDRVALGDWRVERVRVGGDGEVEIAIFGGPAARQRAILYADRLYGDFEENQPGAVLGYFLET